ncbi:hypothetical protein HMI54_011259 [Coelomomyces lativittatus]|nr:hypothetical protein HMI54_011259 [Coelomomyces lativittatus]
MFVQFPKENPVEWMTMDQTTHSFITPKTKNEQTLHKGCFCSNRKPRNLIPCTFFLIRILIHFALLQFKFFH